MKQINLYEAKTNLSALVDEAAAGEEIIIAKNGKARARLVPYQPQAQAPRRFGGWAELYGYRAPNEFPPTTVDEIAAWEGNPITSDDRA